MPDSHTTTQDAPLNAYDQSTHPSCDECGRTNRITTLYAFPGDKPVQIHSFKIAPKYNRLCSQCFETANEHTPHDLENDELIAGIISDSYGYATPAHAARHVNDAKNGKTKCHCERGRAHFDNDLADLLEAARHRWMTRARAEQEALLETVAEWRDVEERDAVAALGVSLSYPSHAPELTVHQQHQQPNHESPLETLSPQELQSTLFIRTDTFKTFTVDTLPDTPGKIAFEYTTDNFPTQLNRTKANTVLNNAHRFNPNTIDTTAHENTFLTPTDADIDALQATMRRSPHPREQHLEYLLSLKNTAGHFNNN